MATYSNKNTDNVIHLGTDFKMNIHMDPVTNGDVVYNLETLEDFKCTFHIKNGNSVTLHKNDMVPIDEDNYVAPLDSNQLGVGVLCMTFEVNIPDDDFNDSLRHEVVPITTNIKIV